MKLRTSSSQLKAKMGQYMRAVRSGKEVVVTDRDQPVARLLPFYKQAEDGEQLDIAMPRDPSALPLGEVEVQAIHYRGKSTTLLLTEDRNQR